ncbi:MAG: hypothetical protein KMY55_09325 [Dethiosulfatibacter sp.]|nr:hypothetical protein [Dethiosulfatibacter sp.]
MSDRFAQDIGADMFVPDASTASEESKKFMMQIEFARRIYRRSKYETNRNWSQ